MTGQNAETAKKSLEDLGLTDIALLSVDPHHKDVIRAKDWTVASINPAPGTVVTAGSPVVLNVTKR